MHLKLIAPLAAALALSACAKTAPTVLAADDPRNDGIARTCTPTNPDMTKPGPHTASIAMTNDGWCGVFATDKDGKPFSLGLVRARPAHGRVFVQKVGNATRVEYTPENNYVGADTFTVALRTAGNEDVPLAVSVNATQGASAAPPPAAAPAPSTTRPTTPAKRNPARRSTPAR